MKALNKYVFSLVMFAGISLNVALAARDGGGVNGIGDGILEDDYRNTSDMPGFTGYQKIYQHIFEMSPRFARRIKKVEHMLDWYIVPKDLPNIEGEIGFDVEGTTQVGIQKGRTIYVSKAKLEGLKPKSQPKVILHEELLYILKDRNKFFKLGLTNPQIHERVRRVGAMLTKFFENSVSGKIYSENEVQNLLAENDFGYWLTGSEIKELTKSLPDATKLLAVTMNHACTTQKPTSYGAYSIRGPTLEKFFDEFRKTCRHCGGWELVNVGGSLGAGASGRRDGKVWTFLSNNVQLEPVVITSIEFNSQTCALAEGVLVGRSNSGDSTLIQELKCENFDELRNSCDEESFGLEIFPLATSVHWELSK